MAPDLDELAPTPPSRAPTPGQAFALFGVSFAVLMVAAGGVEWLALSTTAPAAEWAELSADPARNPLLNDGRWIVALTALPELVLGGVILLSLRYFGLSPRLVLPLTIPKTSTLIGALLLVFGVAPLADVVHLWVTSIPGLPTAWGEGLSAHTLLTRAVGDSGPLGLPLALLGMALVPAVVEESLFRGFVTAAYRGSFLAALVAPSLLFGLFHLDPAQAAATTLLGFAFGLARLLSGSLLASMLAHAGYNAVVLLLIHANATQAGEPTSLTAVLAGLVAAVGGLWLLSARPASPSPRPGERGGIP